MEGNKNSTKSLDEFKKQHEHIDAETKKNIIGGHKKVMFDYDQTLGQSTEIMPQ